MHPAARRLIKAYRPLCVHGQWRDGPCPWPHAVPAPSGRAGFPRMLLFALSGLRHSLFPPRRSS